MKRRAALLVGGRLRHLMTTGEQSATSILNSGFFGAGPPCTSTGIKVSWVSSQVRSVALPAQQVATKLQPDVLPLTHVDEVGAISIIEPHEKDFIPKEFENVDGRRIEDGRYAAFMKDISGGWKCQKCGSETRGLMPIQWCM